jgi:hypothetical protein
LGIAVGLIGFTIISGIIIDLVGISEHASKFPPMREMYHRESMGPDWLAGEVIQVSDRQLSIITPFGKTIIVKWDKDTIFPFGSEFQNGEKVRIIGQWQGDDFIAKGIDAGNHRIPMPNIPLNENRPIDFRK